jgi:FkbM family methyltransferase
MLASSIAINAFANVFLIESAVSSAPGIAQLSLHANSELNELVHGEGSSETSQTVTCVTLDGCIDSHGWKNIDFLKIDAEGEEANILHGAETFLRVESPLIQYEIKAASVMHLDLVRHFSQLGYNSYRLVPGLDLLFPFDEQAAADGYLLNLFCCKPDRAARLAAQGFLVDAVGGVPVPQGRGSGEQWNRSPFVGTRGWQEALSKFPYAELLAGPWAEEMGLKDVDEVEEPLNHYLRSRDESLPKAERFASLEASYLEFQRLCDKEPVNLRLASLARVALDYGARSTAVRALERLCTLLFQRGQINVGEPFLAPAARFDSISPQNQASLGNWLGAAAAEELERIQYYSSFYSRSTTRQRLEIIRDLGFASDEMKRRLMLIEQRFGAPEKT